jgi:uncharacterized peroxidase-related enzyme
MSWGDRKGDSVAFIELVSDEEAADGQAAAIFEEARARFGYVPNSARALAHRPEIHAAWGSLVSAIVGGMDQRRYELVTLAAARRLRSSYCSLAHAKVLLDRFMGAGELRAIVRDPGSAGLDEVDLAAMEVAEKVAGDATAITAADIDRLRALGLRDAEILDIVAAAAVRCFFSKTLDALGVLPDAAYADLEPELRHALEVGRPIESG